MDIFNIDKIYTRRGLKSADLRKWKKLLLSKPKKLHFLMMVLPAMEALFCHLKQAAAKPPRPFIRMSDRLLSKLIWNNFVGTVHPMIIRVCVLEMHLAKTRNLLRGKTAKQRFDYFIKALSEKENCLQLLNKYPILKSQLAIVLNEFYQVYTELVLRLQQDHQDILVHFLHQDEHYRLQAIYGAGDRHRQGREVMLLEFGKKSKKIIVVYKPRSLAIDNAFQNFIDWFNQKTSHLQLLKFKIIDKKDYGWCEYITYRSCKNTQELQHYYYRLGIWLMLTYMLLGYDVHSENLIAHGSYPFVVDFECLFRPFIAFKPTSHDQVSRYFVNETAFLPEKILYDKKHKGFDTSSLGGEGKEQSFYRDIIWVDVGKDTMCARRRRFTIPAAKNQPRLLNKSVDYLTYEPFFTQGFSDTYRLMLSLRSELLGKKSPLRSFKNIGVRVVIRSTEDYNQLLYESWHPKYLLKQTDRHDHFAQLEKETERFPTYHQFLDAEYADLNQNNIPFFAGNTSGKTLVDSRGRPLAVKVIQSGYDAVLTCLNHYLNEKDLALQQILIKNSFDAARLNKISENLSATPLFIPKTALSFSNLQTKALSIAKRELDKLAALSVIKDNLISWPLVTLKGPEVFVASFTDTSLYEGIAGISLSFALGAEIFQNSSYRHIAKRCLADLQTTVIEENPKEWESIGAFDGIGGILYTLNQLHKIWHIKNLKPVIYRIIENLPQLIAQDKSLDIISGSAGCLVCLLRLQGLVPKSLLMPLIKNCVDHILQHYPNPSEFPHKGFSLPASKPLLGFSHGVAGIAWALHQSHLVAPREDVKHWIEAALAYEREQFNKTYANWPDFRKNSEKERTSDPGFMTAWCHGAAGIGLARLELMQQWPEQQLHEEVAIALQTTARTGFSDEWSLCHGSLGNLELFFTASQYLNDPTLTLHYHRLATAVLDQLENHPIHFGPLPQEALPGLMCGCAGIIYQLLRIAYPDKVPSVLLLKV